MAGKKVIVARGIDDTAASLACCVESFLKGCGVVGFCVAFCAEVEHRKCIRRRRGGGQGDAEEQETKIGQSKTGKWTREEAASAVTTQFRYGAANRIPSPPLEERARERRPFVSKLLFHNTNCANLQQL